MPMVLRSGPFRFFFYAGDRDEPPHVHVEHDDNEAKFWLDPVLLHRNLGFAAHELSDIEKLVVEHREHLIESWHEFFGG